MDNQYLERKTRGYIPPAFMCFGLKINGITGNGTPFLASMLALKCPIA